MPLKSETQEIISVDVANGPKTELLARKIGLKKARAITPPAENMMAKSVIWSVAVLLMTRLLS